MQLADAARHNVQLGHVWLDKAYESAGQSLQQASYQAAIATAHFSAAMAITNLLLADPAEAPDPVEL